MTIVSWHNIVTVFVFPHELWDRSRMVGQGSFLANKKQNHHFVTNKKKHDFFRGIFYVGIMSCLNTKNRVFVVPISIFFGFFLVRQEGISTL